MQCAVVQYEETRDGKLPVYGRRNTWRLYCVTRLSLGVCPFLSMRCQKQQGVTSCVTDKSWGVGEREERKRKRRRTGKRLYHRLLKHGQHQPVNVVDDREIRWIHFVRLACAHFSACSAVFLATNAVRTDTYCYTVVQYDTYCTVQ